MKKKMKTSIMSAVVLIGIAIMVSLSTSTTALASQGLILKNAEALGSECKDGKVTGSPFPLVCGTPIGLGQACTTNMITCQGDTNCCEPRGCSLH